MRKRLRRGVCTAILCVVWIYFALAGPILVRTRDGGYRGFYGFYITGQLGPGQAGIAAIYYPLVVLSQATGTELWLCRYVRCFEFIASSEPPVPPDAEGRGGPGAGEP